MLLRWFSLRRATCPEDSIGGTILFSSLSACALCCQQYPAKMTSLARVSNDALPTIGSTFLAIWATGANFEDAMVRLHGRPLDVMPLQVVEDSLESLRERRASGVRPVKVIIEQDGWGIMKRREQSTLMILLDHDGNIFIQ